MPLRKGSAAFGFATAGAGALSLGLGLLGSPLVPPAPLGLPGHALATALGLALAVLGALLVVFSMRRVPEAPAIVPAHVAFVTRTARPLAMPEPLSVPARRAAPSRRPEEQAAMTRLDDEIRELTRQINKAGILLATGQISRQGYSSYVDDLKAKRGALEASRVRIELHRVE